MITIIILLILAGVTINLTLGDNEIFKAAEEAGKKQKIAEYKDRIEISKATVLTNNLGEITLDKLIDEIYKDKIVEIGKITKTNENEAEMITNEGYKFKITTNGAEYLEQKEEEKEEPKQTYLITYDLQGGEGTVPDQTKVEGTTLKISEVKPTKEGYVFMGWTDRKDSRDVKYLVGDEYTAEENAKLYAVWGWYVSLYKMSTPGFQNLSLNTSSMSFEGCNAYFKVLRR